MKPHYKHFDNAHTHASKCLNKSDRQRNLCVFRCVGLWYYCDMFFICSTSLDWAHITISTHVQSSTWHFREKQPILRQSFKFATRSHPLSGFHWELPILALSSRNLTPWPEGKTVACSYCLQLKCTMKCILISLSNKHGDLINASC